MTCKELRIAIKVLGGTKYSAMKKCQLEAYLAQLEAQAEARANAERFIARTKEQTTVNNTKEEVQMTNKVTKIKEFKTRTKEHKGYTTFWKEGDPITAGQKRLYASLTNNFQFDEPRQACKDALEMSKLLYDMEVKVDSGEVQRRSDAEIVERLKEAKQSSPAPVQRAVNSNYPTPKQVKWIKDLGVKLNRTVVIPHTKSEASDMIKQLDAEYQKSLFKATQAVAVTKDAEPTEKRVSFFQHIISYFKRG